MDSFPDYFMQKNLQKPTAILLNGGRVPKCVDMGAKQQTQLFGMNERAVVSGSQRFLKQAQMLVSSCHLKNKILFENGEFSKERWRQRPLLKYTPRILSNAVIVATDDVS